MNEYKRKLIELRNKCFSAEEALAETDVPEVIRDALKLLRDVPNADTQAIQEGHYSGKNNVLSKVALAIASEDPSFDPGEEEQRLDELESEDGFCLTYKYGIESVLMDTADMWRLEPALQRVQRVLNYRSVWHITPWYFADPVNYVSVTWDGFPVYKLRALDRDEQGPSLFQLVRSDDPGLLEALQATERGREMLHDPHCPYGRPRYAQTTIDSCETVVHEALKEGVLPETLVVNVDALCTFLARPLPPFERSCGLPEVG